jgi:hypothetical protein
VVECAGEGVGVVLADACFAVFLRQGDILLFLCEAGVGVGALEVCEAFHPGREGSSTRMAVWYEVSSRVRKQC